MAVSDSGGSGRRSGIARYQIAHDIFQRSEPGLVMTPMIDAFGINRPAHLLGADGADDAPSLVEAQALLFERQPAVVEEPLHLSPRIGDQLLVINAMHAIRERRVDMLHVCC